MRRNSKIVLVSTGLSIGILVSSMVLIFLAFCVGRANGCETLSEMIKDPGWWIVMLFSLVLSTIATLYFIVTEEGIRLCWLCFFGKLIRFDDMTEIGVFTGGQYSIRKIPRIAYFGYNHPDGYIKYKFLPEYSRNLYEYLKDMNGLPFAYDKMDGKRRNEVWQPGKLTEYVVIGAALFFFIVISFCAIILFVRNILYDFSWADIVLLPVLIFLGIMIKFLLGILFAISAKFRFDEQSVYIKFPLHKEFAYGWDEFQQVCICYSYVTSVRGGPNKIIICFVKKGVNKEKVSKRWPTDTGFQYKNVPFIRYTPAALEEVKKYCPYEIVDLRGTGTYYH